MTPTIARLLVLLSSFGLMALAPAAIELVPLPQDAAPAAVMPDLPDWRALARAPGPPLPPAHPRLAAVRPADALRELGHFSDPPFLAEIARRQARDAAEAVVLLRGSFDLAGLARAIDDPAILEPHGDIFTLRRPLVIRHDAALLVPGGHVLRLATASGAFLVNGGQLIVKDAQITSWDARRQAPSELARDREFRPFVTAIAGSWTGIADTTLSHLGYDAAKSYGISLVSGPSSFVAAPAPTGRITGSRISGNYYGFYSYEAEDVVIADNLLVDNLVYGLDPHDRSRRLIIAGNTAIGTERRHGIVISRGVSDSWIIENRAIGNAGTGIVIDAASTDNVIALNLAGANRGDGLSLFESARNLLWGNVAIANAKSGLRVRNGWAIAVHRNTFVDNGYDGIEAYGEVLPPRLANRWRLPAELRLDMTLRDNRFAGNRRTALNLRSPGRIDLLGGSSHARPLRLGGDLEGCAEAIHRRITDWGSVRIIGREQAPAAARCAGS